MKIYKKWSASSDSENIVSRNININFCQWEYEYFTIEETI